MDFAVMIIDLVRTLKAKHETVISNQIGRSGTSIGANIREAQYAHGKADFIARFQIALKEANETGYWLELLNKTGYLSKDEYKALDTACTSIRVMLICILVQWEIRTDRSSVPGPVQKRTGGGRRGFSDGDSVYPSESCQSRAVRKA